MKTMTYTAVAVLAMVSSLAAQLTPAESTRLASAARVVQDIRDTIPQEYWDRARCVAVIPDLKKAAFVFGGEYGKGLMSCRSGDRWGAPLFLQLAKGSWGFQVGAEQVDVVMLIMNESGVQKLLQNKVNLGADASVAAGPLGRQGHIGTDAFLKAEILAYSRAQGLFAGVDLSGGVLRPDEDANANAYGRSATPQTILAAREISAPTQASPFLRALEAGPTGIATVPKPGTTATPTPRPTTANPAPTTDSDLRTRLVDMQQTLERLMTDGNRGPVGTSGNTGGVMMTVDRAQLELLRRQIDSALSTVDRR